MVEKWRKTLLPFMEKAQQELGQLDPFLLAARSGLEYEGSAREGRFAGDLFGQRHLINYPDFTVRLADSDEPSSPERQSMFLHYLRTADGTRLADRWISFRELPDGAFYHRAFQGYCGDRLARTFGNEPELFRQAARVVGGTRLSLGDVAFAFQALPRVPLAVIYWLGDEEFPPTAQVLFDASASHYLPTDGLAVLGNWLCDRLVKGG